ncbi:MAG: tRNA (adenosine(37)-N6)-dimethylallyltransferase MiaA [Bacilli bacterium]
MVYVILGQTASGKTSLALKLAREFSLPVISADAYQCYKMMQIGTDKPTKEQTEGVDYYFYDEYSPDENIDVYTFQSKMRKVLDKYQKEGKDVLVVGGTFLYIKALLFNYVFSNEEKVVSPYEDKPLEELSKLLKARSEQTYLSIDVKNKRRVVRALDQLDQGITRQEILSLNNDIPLYPVTFLRIDIDKEIGNQKIDARIEQMFKQGIVSEVKKLLDQYPSDCRSFLAIGYKEIISGLQNNETEELMKETIKIHTHQYAKKQRTFIKNQFSDVTSGNNDEIYQLIKNNILMKERTRILLSPNVISRIEKSSILFVGLGGVGGQALISLARLGFRNFVLIDGDSVDPSNLNRQALFDYNSIGKSKAIIAKEKLLLINPLIKAESLATRITSAEEIPERKFDIIIDCIDDCNAKGLLFKKSVIDSSLYLTSMGMGFHLDSTKVKFGKMKDAFDHLSKSFRQTLTDMGYNETQINEIDCVYATDGRIKGKQNSKTIGSVSTVPNSAGLALVSLLLSKFQKEDC